MVVLRCDGAMTNDDEYSMHTVAGGGTKGSWLIANTWLYTTRLYEIVSIASLHHSINHSTRLAAATIFRSYYKPSRREVEDINNRIVMSLSCAIFFPSPPLPRHCHLLPFPSSTTYKRQTTLIVPA